MRHNDIVTAVLMACYIMLYNVNNKYGRNRTTFNGDNLNYNRGGMLVK